VDSEKKPGQPDEQEAVFTTIVGGRPPGSGTRVGAIPRGVEVLLKKASVDPAFRELLLKERGEAARRIDLELTDAEREMLAHIPAEQLEAIIRNTKVHPKHRAIFLGTAGALMVAAVIGLCSYTSQTFSRIESLTNGIRPDEIRRMQAPPQDEEGSKDKSESDPNRPETDQSVDTLEGKEAEMPRRDGRVSSGTLGIRPD
jgi:hypothetical protein